MQALLGFLKAEFGLHLEIRPQMQCFLKQFETLAFQVLFIAYIKR